MSLHPARPAPGAAGQLLVAPGLLEKLLAAVRPEFRADELAFGLDDPVLRGPVPGRPLRQGGAGPRAVPRPLRAVARQRPA